MFKSSKKQTFMPWAFKALSLVSLSAAVCMYSFGLCFIDHHHEILVSNQPLNHCCECPGHHPDTGVPAETTSCGYQHHDNSFHLHETVHALIPGQNKEIRPDTPGLNSATPLHLAVDLSFPDKCPVREDTDCRHGMRPGVPLLSSQTLPLLI